MASTSVAIDAAPERIVADRYAFAQGAVLALAFVAVYWYVLSDLAYVWWTSSDWSHGWVVPAFSAYLIYVHWNQVKRCPIRHTWVGLLLVVAALVGYQVSLWWIVIGYIRPTSMLVCVLGIAIYLCGLPVLRHAWVPWLYLFFAIPLPKGVYYALTDPLRRIAATVAASILGLVPNLDIERVGSLIQYSYGTRSGALGVEDACSGMHSLIALCAIGVAVAFISDRPRWQQVVMVLACVPIAVFTNLVRVLVTCVLHIFVDPQYAEGGWHWALGIGTMALGFALFCGVAWLLSKIIEEAPADEPEAAEAG